MDWIDGHIDLAYVAIMGRDIQIPCEDKNSACISIPDLVQSPINTFFGTIYTSPNYKEFGYDHSGNRKAAFKAGEKQLHVYQELEAASLLSIQHEGCELKDSLSMLLLMEGADPIRSPEDVAWWREQGLRLVGLTWSVGTRYSGGNSSGGPITEEGIELVKALDEHSVVHDVSHLSDEAFDCLFKHATGKIVASHSNSRALLETSSQRNLRDDQAKAIFNRGGVVGLNLCTQFLVKPKKKEKHTASIDDCVKHVLHFCELAGNRRQVALGSDFDGGFTPQYLPIGLKHPSMLPALTDALAKEGFDEEDLQSFTHGAWMRVFS